MQSLYPDRVPASHSGTGDGLMPALGLSAMAVLVTHAERGSEEFSRRRERM